jgi:nitroimidazol reductase NimA-like FMN-containing flavoprotein (pyridoxamine 5'-phosphate oxidase superfamily)
VSRFRELSAAECLARLESQSGGVGRIALTTPTGPMIYPLNFVVHEQAVVFRTSASTALGRSPWGVDVAFEVDHLDLKERQGWSVVVRGCAHIIDDPDDEDRMRSLRREPQPWADGLRRTYIRIPMREITGRIIGPDWLGTPSPLPHSWLG